MRFCWRHGLALAALATALSSAHAVEFNQFQPGKSTLSFVSKQMNVPVEGRFKSFRSKLAFDPAKPAAAKAELEIDLASIDAGSKDADDEVAGRMSIKGRTLDLTTPVSVRQEGNSAIFDGSLVLKRADYGIGDGIWADFGTVANEVQIKFRLVANAAAAK